MKKSKIAMGIMVFIIAALLLIGVPICINLCFKPENRWTAGNVLTYYGATLSFLGTVIFSSLSIYQNIQIRKEADKREKILRDMELKKNYPLIKCRLDGYCGNYQNVQISFSNISDNVADNIEIIFIGSNGAKAIASSTVSSAIDNVLKRLRQQGIEIERFTHHAFRDTFATRYIEEGGNMQTLQKILGHSSLAMTADLYAHVLPNTKQQEMQQIENGFIGVAVL